MKLPYCDSTARTLSATGAPAAAYWASAGVVVDGRSMGAAVRLRPATKAAAANLRSAMPIWC